MGTLLDEYSKAFDDVCNTLSKVIKEAISKSEADLGRPLTKEEKEFCIRIGVPFCLLKFLSKGE